MKFSLEMWQDILVKMESLSPYLASNKVHRLFNLQIRRLNNIKISEDTQIFFLL